MATALARSALPVSSAALTCAMPLVALSGARPRAKMAMNHQYPGLRAASTVKPRPTEHVTSNMNRRPNRSATPASGRPPSDASRRMARPTPSSVADRPAWSASEFPFTTWPKCLATSPSAATAPNWPKPEAKAMRARPITAGSRQERRTSARRTFLPSPGGAVSATEWAAWGRGSVIGTGASAAPLPSASDGTRVREGAGEPRRARRWSFSPTGRPSSLLGSGAPAPPERGVEQGEEHHRHARRADHVPGPRPERSQERPVGRRCPQEHVVRVRQRVHHAHERGVPRGEEEGAPHRARPRLEAHPDDEEQGRRHDAEVPHDVLEEHQVREARVEVGGDDRLQRAGEPPEVGQLDEDAHARPTRRRRHQHRHVAQRERERRRKREGALHDEGDDVADGGGGERGPDQAG